MRAAKQVVRYLIGTKTLGIDVSGGGPLVAFVDADWAGDEDHRRSVSGFVIGHLRPDQSLSPVGWRVMLQTAVATSSCFAEYTACHDVCREVFALRQVYAEAGWPLGGATSVFCDNKAAVAIGESASGTIRTKGSRYVDIRYHYARWCSGAGHVSFRWVKGSDNPADLFTKPLGVEVFQRHRSRMMVDVGTLDV